MVAKAADLDGTAMSWEEFDALGEIRAEYIDGRLVMAPGPIRRHQTASRRLTNLLEPALEPSFGVVEAWSWKPGRDEFVPDILVYPAPMSRFASLGRRCSSWKCCRQVRSGIWSSR